MDKPLKTIRGEDAFRRHIRSLCANAKKSEVAATYNLSPSHLSNIINGYGCIGPEIAKRFGYEKQSAIVFVPRMKRRAQQQSSASGKG